MIVRTQQTGAARMSSRLRPAVSIVEVLVVIGVIALLISMLLPSLCRAREQGNRVKCASNLRQIGLAIQMYVNDNKGHLPRTYFDESDEPVPTAFTGATAADPFGPGGPAANDVSAALYLVLRTQDLTSEVFVCPSSSAERSAGDSRTTSNFASADVFSYSYNNPYPSKVWRDAMKSDSLTFAGLPSDFALAADINPGRAELTTLQPRSPRAEMMKGNTDNHNRDGQNVLYADGHVEFQTTPFAGELRKDATGEFRDNIYVSGGNGTDAPIAINGPMVDVHDSVLLPTANPLTAPTPIKVAMNTREFGARRIVWLTSGAVMLGACGSGGLAIRTAKRRKTRAAKAPHVR